MREVSVIVALRKESVDRNFGVLSGFMSLSWSLSARRAWIEIFGSLSLVGSPCRSPQGERG